MLDRAVYVTLVIRLGYPSRVTGRHTLPPSPVNKETCNEQHESKMVLVLRKMTAWQGKWHVPT